MLKRKILFHIPVFSEVMLDFRRKLVCIPRVRGLRLSEEKMWRRGDQRIGVPTQKRLVICRKSLVNFLPS